VQIRRNRVQPLAMDRSTNPPMPTHRSAGAWLMAMPRWKKIALLSATALLATGAVMMLVSPGAPPTPGPGTASGAADLQANLVPGGTPTGPGTGQPVPVPEEPAAKGVFRLGFSFIAGFCIGTFIRSTLKVASIAFGFWLVMTLALSYYGVVNVDWQAIDQLWNRFCANVEGEWGNFQRFMTGSLPAAGLAVAGLATGLKRH